MDELQPDPSEQDDVVRMAETVARLLHIAPARLRLECSFDPKGSLGRTYLHIGPLSPDELRALAAEELG